ncbi:MAG: lysophospholipid acyltransferase family protein [bacterium]
MKPFALAREFGRCVSGGVARDIRARVEALEDFDSVPGSGYDVFGASRETLAGIMPVVYFFYKFYFRTVVHGIENVAALPRGLIIPNHMVQLPVDGMNICSALFFEPQKPRLVRAVGHYLLAKSPFMSIVFSRTGQVIGSNENADRLFAGDNLVLIFPEGAEAIRPYFSPSRYRLTDFNVGFMEYAIRYGYPVVPTAVIGSEESVMILGDSAPLSKLFGLPHFGLTPTFPWLGPLGGFPYPVRFRIWFGEPMDFSAHADRLDDPEGIRLLVEEVRDRVQEMLDRHRAKLTPLSFL